MSTMFNLMRSLAASRGARWIGVPVLMATALAAVVSQSQTTIPTMSLSAEPLYARGARAKPTLTLALSVEFPTVGAQYVSTPGATTDDTYAPGTEYIGYFDANSCYTYNNGGTAADRYFIRSGAATGHACAGAGFSGNFMNWATSSAIDILRYGLTGGDRVVDTSTLTVLQRAVLPNTSVSNNFWNGSNFPAKILRVANVAGAVPSTLLGSHTGDVYVANCLNRVHFGTQATGSCASPGNNSNLGVPAGSVTLAIGPVSSVTSSLPTGGGWSNCAAENGTCTFSGIREVAYGTNSNGGGWITMPVSSSTGIACSNNMTGSFRDPKPGVVKECQVRYYYGDWTPPTSAATLTSDGFFYSRVRVCESDGSGNLLDPRTSLCQRYPSGNYKPVGNLQKYSDRVRVAAFGYLNDSPGNPQRYGGVLRAPMKYVGPKYFDSNFTLLSSTNPTREWDESTGQLLANPEGQSSINSGADSSNPNGPLSGVINYLNQFGRTGANLGQYKTYDPVGELYYEAVRYVQGLQPTNLDSTVGGSATYGVTDTMRDGFPVYTTWTDPHPAVSGMTDYSCVKNNVVGIGDVNTHNDRTIPGNPATRTGKGDVARTASAAANEPNFYDWTKVVGAFESNHSEITYLDGSGTSRAVSNPNTAITSLWGMENTNIGADNAAYYMAGVAYWANTHDIRGTDWTETDKRRPGMRLTTYWLDVNEYGNQSVQATRVKNQFYLAAKYGGFKDVTKTGNPFKSYTAGTTTMVDSNENWVNSAGEAKNYFLSSSANAVLAALDQIFAQIASEANSIAGGAISTQRLTTSGGQIYQAQFDPADWSGDLVAYPVSVSASSVVSIGVPADSPWRNSASAPVGAAGKLDDLSDIDSRKIYVGYNSAAGVFGTTEFKWNSLNSVTQNALRMPPYAASAAMDPASAGENRLKYLRGDRTLETGGTFRRRSSRLGDIVNSGVAYAGTPAVVSSDTAFTTFYNSYKTREKALYVGANDGMLHAFNAATGAELFAYIPSWLVPRLPNLTSPNYVHAAYVDGTPEVAEAKVGSTWKTVLVGGTAGGGQGVFALDVSDPSAFDDSKVMWEFTDRHDPEMGNVIGHPKILKVNTAAGTSTPAYKYFAVFASGVNNYAADGYSLTSADANFGSPVLFFLDLSKAKNGAWTLGSNYFKVRFPVATTAIASGMAEFATRLGNAGELTYVYAGDMQGNLWKLDFTSTAIDDWSLATLSYFKDGSTPIPMFIAKDGSNAANRQPISMAPALIFGASRTILVSFGTGKYLEASDTAGPYKAQSVYTLLDNNSATADTSSSPAAAIAGRGRLAQGTWSSGAIDVPAFTWGRPTSDTGTVKSGWVFDFYNSDTVTGTGGRLGTGERQISGMGVLAGKLIFGTVIPAVNSCDNGSGNLYVLKVGTGDGDVQASTVGILGEPFLAQLGPSRTKIGTTGSSTETVPWQVILQGSAGLSAPPSLRQPVTGPAGRLSWREIIKH
jgi:type IV pilus assembly protein PilY1